MKMLSSLRSRIFLASALLAVLSIGTAISLVRARVTRELESSLRREIRSTASLVEQLRTTRAQTYTTMARLIADAPKMKAAVDTDDPATVQDNADDYQSQLNSSLLLVTNKAGQVLATVGAPPRAALLTATLTSVRSALTGREGTSLIPQPDGILQLVTVPMAIGVSHPDILGTLSVGFLLDDTFAAQLKQITGSDIAFGMDGDILASTLASGGRASLASLLSQSDQAPRNVTLGSDQYVVLPMRLSPPTERQRNGGGPMVLIMRSRTEQLRFLQTINTELTGTAVVAVLLATLLSFVVARTITQPLATITSVMRDVAATGDLTRKITLRRGQRWGDEDARLLAATFNSLTDSVARAQREMSQRERLSSLGRLSTVIAHEIRNPLMIIKAALHGLRQPDISAEALRDVAADIDEEVGRLNRIVNEVLDFARPIPFELAVADLNEVCRQSAAAAQAGPGPYVEVDVDPSVPLITTDAERLRVALVNLVVNARQAVDGKGAAVSLSTRRQDTVVSIVVSDQGSGIDRVDLPRVFDPYFTTKRGGTGLGLPLAKNIIEGLGGTISVVSEPSRGTEFLIEFPLDITQGRSVA